MVQEPEARIFVISDGRTLLGVQQEFWQLLKQRIHFRHVDSVDKCDVVFAFVPIVSRAGTDIQAALQKLPTSRPVVLIVLHNTFDENYIAPQSKWHVKREDMLAVDFLCNEDVGLLECQANDVALKSISIKPYTDNMPPDSPTSQLISVQPSRLCRYKWIIILCLLFIVTFIVILTLCLYLKKGQNHHGDT